MSKSVYDKNERTDVPGFLTDKFGKNGLTAERENIIRLALITQVRASYHFFASNFVWITNKDGKRTTLRPFLAQAIHRVALDSQLRAGLPGYIAEAKVRQQGLTMDNIARGLHYSLDEDKRALILVDDEDVAAEQSTRLGMMLNGLPQWLQPMRRIQSMKHYVFDNPNPKDRLIHPGLNSAIQITVPSSFRGVPPGYVCVSEYAHMDYDRQKAVQDGIISAASMRPNSIIIFDSTPAGYDDSYYPLVMEAYADNERWCKKIESWKGELSAQDVLDGILGIPDSVEKGYPTTVLTVCPWRLHEEYDCRSPQNPMGELPPLRPAQREEILSSLGKIAKYGGEEEVELKQRYEVSDSRLFWRRMKINRYKLPTDELKLLTFRQEFFGSTVEESFVESGQAPFPRDCLDVLQRQVVEPAAVGLFEEPDKFAYWKRGGEPIAHLHRDPNPWHEIRIYAPPQNGEKYTMGVDTDIAYESPDSDASVAQVVRFRDAKVVATYTARVPSHLMMQQLYCLYRWYFNCYYAIETAGMGYDLVRRCIDRGMTNVHYYKRYDQDYPEPTKFPGWESSKPFMRALMDQTLLQMICARDPATGRPIPACVIPDAQTVREIRNLSRTPSGSYKSLRGKDDHVDALDIAWCIALDPYSGLIKRAVDEEADKKKEFDERFRWLMGSKVDRNNPDLANL